MYMTNSQNFISVLTLGGKKVEYEQCEKGTVPQVPCVALLKMASFCIFWVKIRMFSKCQILRLVDSF